MALQQRLVVAGISATQAAATQGTVAMGLTSTGTSSQATALPVPADLCFFSTVALNSGAILPAANPGDSGTLFNGGANALLLYPPVGGKINSLGTNAAYSVAAATPFVDWWCVTPTQYICSQSA